MPTASNAPRRSRGRARTLPVVVGLLVVAGLLAPMVGWRLLETVPPPCVAPHGPPMGPPPPVPDRAVAAARRGPVGWDTLRELTWLPHLPVGTQPRMFSSADPRGGNDDGFRSTYLCRAPDGYVLAEHSGPGELTSLWFTRAGGDVGANGNLRIELDGEVVLDAPLEDVVDGRLGPPFVHPLVANASQASGGAVVQVPMPFRRSMRVLTTGLPRFHRVQLRAFADAAGVRRFDPDEPVPDVLAALRDPDRLVAPPPGRTTRRVGRALRLDAGAASPPVVLRGAGMVTGVHLRLPGPTDRASSWRDERLAGLRLQVVADGRRTVDAPVAELLGVGLGARPLETMAGTVDPDGRHELRWPMPFADRMEVRLVNGASQPVPDGALAVRWHRDDRWTRWLGPDGRAGHFHAVARAGRTTPTQDWPLASLTGHGRLVGIGQTVVGRQPSRLYLEGDERIRVDGAGDPQLHGTGTEDLYLAGWYYLHGPFDLPFAAHSAHLQDVPGCPYACDAMIRVLAADSIAYHGGVEASIEHGPDNDVEATYRTATVGYHRPDPAMHRTDVLDVGDPASEAAAGYTGTGELRELTSRYVGRDDARRITDRLRSTSQEVRFRVAVDPANGGVLLRRRADAARQGQAAQVLVGGVPAAVWYQPDGNATSRWHDDDLLLPPRVTAGRRMLELTLRPLAGHPPWTAARYETYSLRAVDQ